MFAFTPLLALLVLVLVQLQRDIRAVQRLAPAGITRSPIMRAGIVFLLLATVPLLFVQFSGLGGSIPITPPVAWGTCIALSFLMSYTWYRYLTWLDPFEREGRRWELFVFIMGCAATFLTWPLTDLVVPTLGLKLDGDPWNDWWFSVIGIGLVEETVKLLPLLVLLAFTRQADEPYDLILYASLGALGFAFVENTLYLLRTDLHAVGGRVLYASVAHLFFSSIVAYAIAMARHKGRPVLPYALVGLLLAALAHGFYDYWLLSPARPYLFTLMFFLGSIHLWVAMKGNLVNLSPHYQEEMRPQPTMFRYRMINALSAIFLFAFVMKFMLEGRAAAYALLHAQGSTMATTLLFLAISLSSFRFVPGYIAPLRPKGQLWRMLLPVVSWGEDLTGRRLLMRFPEQRSDARHFPALHRSLPLEGRLAQRVIMDDDQDWYLFKPDAHIPFDGADSTSLLIRPHRENDTLPEDRYVVVVTMAFNGTPLLHDGRAQRAQLEFAGFVHGRLL